MVAADMLLHHIRKHPPKQTHAHTHTRTLCPSFSVLLPWLQTGEIILSATKNAYLRCRMESRTEPSLATPIIPHISTTQQVMWLILTGKDSQMRKSVNYSASQWPDLYLLYVMRRQNVLLGTNKKRCIARCCVRMTAQGKMQSSIRIRTLLKSIFNQFSLVHYLPIILNLIDYPVDQYGTIHSRIGVGIKESLVLIDSCNVCVPRVCACVFAHDPPMHPCQ